MDRDIQSQVRRLLPRDGSIYRDLRLVALTTDPAAFGATLEAEKACTPEELAWRLDQDAVFGAWQGGRLCAMAQVSICQPGNNRHKARLGGMYVVPWARGSGIARAVLDAALDWAAHHVEEVLLGVVADNAAGMRLYSAAGFRPYGMEPRAIKHGDTYHDVVLMRLSLDPGWPLPAPPTPQSGRSAAACQP